MSSKLYIDFTDQQRQRPHRSHDSLLWLLAIVWSVFRLLLFPMLTRSISKISAYEKHENVLHVTTAFLVFFRFMLLLWMCLCALTIIERAV